MSIRLLGMSDAEYSYDYRYIAYIADDILFLDDMFLLQYQDSFPLQYPEPFSIQCQNPRSAK
jgi:hypothetical protein